MPAQTHGVGDPRTAGSLLQIAGLAQVSPPIRLAPGPLPNPWLARRLREVCGGWGGVRGVPALGLAGHRGGGRLPLPASGERSSPDAPRGAASREQEPEAEQRPGPRAAHAAPGALRARPLAVAAPSPPSPPARPRRLPPPTRGARFPAQRREGGREAGAGRGRAFPASPGPAARPPAPCTAAANPEGAPGGRAPPPGGPPGAHLSPAPFAA